MDKAYLRYKALMEELETDPEYQELERLRQEKLRAFRAVMQTLTREQRDALMEYIAASEEQSCRVLELAFLGQ